MGDLRTVVAGSALACALVSVHAAPADAQADARVIGASRQDFAAGFEHFTNATNVSGFSGPVVSDNGRVFFTTGVRDADTQQGYGRGLFVDNGVQTTALLGPDELGSERLIQSTVDFPGDVRIRATGSNGVLLVANVDGVDGLWNIDVDEAEATLIAGEGVDGIINIGLDNFADDARRAFWGDRNGNTYFSGLQDFANRLFRHDGTSSTTILGEGLPAPGFAGVVESIRYVAMDDSGALTAGVWITLDAGGEVAAILRYTVAGWTTLAGPDDGLVASGTTRFDLGRGGHVVLEANYFDGERVDPSWLRVSPDGSVDVLATVFEPPPGGDAPIANASLVHATPNGTAVFSASIVGQSSVLIAEPGSAIEVAYREGETPLGIDVFEAALGFASDDQGRLYISAQVADGRVVVQTDVAASSPGATLFSEALTYTVDGQERAAESLFFGWGGRFSSRDGAVVCSRLDLDAPTDVGIVCLGSGDDSAEFGGSIREAGLEVTFSVDPGQVPNAEYHYVVELDVTATEGLSTFDLTLDATPAFAGEFEVVDSSTGEPVPTCTVLNTRVTCIETVAGQARQLGYVVRVPASDPEGYAVDVELVGTEQASDPIALDSAAQTLVAADLTLQRGESAVEWPATLEGALFLIDLGQIDNLVPESADDAASRIDTPLGSALSIPTSEARPIGLEAPAQSEFFLLVDEFEFEPGDGCGSDQNYRCSFKTDSYDPEVFFSNVLGPASDQDPPPMGGGGESKKGLCSAASSGHSAWPLFLAIVALGSRRRGR